MKLHIKKLRIAILVIALTVIPIIFGGCYPDLFSSCGGAEHSVTYVLNAEDAAFAEGEENPTKFMSNQSVLLYSPTREGYRFRGWYDNPDFDGWAWSNIPGGTDRDLTLYAKWAEESEAVWWEGFYPYLEKFSAAESGDTLQLNSRDELSAYLEYVQYNYIQRPLMGGVRISLGYAHSGNVQSEISSVHEHLPYSSYVGLSYSSGSTPVISIYYNDLIGKEASRQASTVDRYEQITPAAYEVTGAEHEFAIDGVENALECTTSNQLYYAAQIGVKPLPTSGSSAERMYAKAKAALGEAVNADMTDAEKVVAIFDWLVMNVTYDDDVLQYSDNVDLAARYDAFYLEGVFDSGRAVCDGISKAMTLMCRIEGIPCVRVTGGGHAWNKVFIDGTWYIVDATFGDTCIPLKGSERSFMNRKYLLTTESASDRYAYATSYTDPVYAADVDYGYYHKTTFEYNGETYDFVINSRLEYVALSNWARSLGREEFSVDFYIDSIFWVTDSTFTRDGNYVTVFFNVR